MADPAPPYSPIWYRNRLLEALDKQAKKVALLEKYNAGDHPLPTPPKGMSGPLYDEARRAHRTLSEMGVTNVVPLVAKAPSDRLTVRGFRFGETLGGDDAAWRIWQRNHMDAAHRDLIDTSMVCSTSYLLVWADKDGKATMTAEHPSQMIVAYAPGSRYERVAALKRFASDDGRLYCTLYLPDAIYKWQTRSRSPNYGQAMGFGNGWEERPVPGETWPLSNPLGEVPVYELAVNAGLQARPFGGGIGEFESVLPIQNRINLQVFNRLVTAEFMAYPQRWITGWEPPVDPETNQPDPRAILQLGQARALTFGDSAAKVGAFPAADFSQLLACEEADLTMLCTVSLTPHSYLPLDLKNLGAETLVQTNIGFVAKCARHRDNLSERMEEAIRAALRIEKDPRANDQQCQVLWDNIEVRTIGESSNAALQYKALAVPEEVCWSLLPGVGQQDINLWKTLGAADRIQSSLTIPDLSVPSNRAIA